MLPDPHPALATAPSGLSPFASILVAVAVTALTTLIELVELAAMPWDVVWLAA
jgi:hypothetical protein